MLADQLTKFVPGSHRLETAMSSTAMDILETSTLMVETWKLEVGDLLLVFASLGLVWTLNLAGKTGLALLRKICCRRDQVRHTVTLADAIAQTDHEQNHAVPQQALCISDADDYPWFDETLVNTQIDADTIPAQDAELERLRRIPSARLRGQAAGPIYLHGSSSASTER